eukprot:CAMPEP_0167795404 /NCGR_PEP_ID=MMETSP0111_2-20121227/14420_1 /TAXON_ID=91324 /ORGANISM="Lotharella globosa, Strain CCCM811" /LENGTH=1049 /DNA_ID=CAMNT_0007689075 /DNA_START=37 /DNA_END=3187 /DNA_ORIENTATION=+
MGVAGSIAAPTSSTSSTPVMDPAEVKALIRKVNPERLAAVESAAALAEILDEKTTSLVMRALAQNGTKESRSAFASGLKLLKQRLHPLRADPEAETLMQRYHATKARMQGEGAEDLKTAEKTKLRGELMTLARAYAELCRQHEATAAGRTWAQVFGRIERAFAAVAKLDAGSGRSNRAKRAKRAGEVFSRHAGVCRIADAKSVDKHGNAKGTEYDLGKDGAYDGLEIVIIQCYGFSMTEPIAALRGKGFVVHHHRRVVDAKVLDAQLKTASQVWVISGSAQSLQEQHLEVIANHWKRGLGLYIFGDNQPFYTDANALLERVVAKALPSDHKLVLEGNYPGAQTVQARNSDGQNGGFLRHLLTTGIVTLYEGITVARMDKRAAMELGCDEVLRDHDDNLIVVARPASGGLGPLIVDGAFTKLYCQWGDAGSARFVRNCACWLSTIVGNEGGGVAAAEEEDAKGAASANKKLSLEGAFQGECALLCERGPVALLASTRGDLDANTSDFAIDNPLALSRANLGALSRQTLGLKVAKSLLEQGEDPFTRRPVEAVIPAVKLSNPANLRIVSEIVNKVFMGGRLMTRTSFMIFLGVLDALHAMEGEDDDLRATAKFMIDEILDNITSSPEFTEFGPQVPLASAMKGFFEAKDRLVPVRKAFGHVAVMARLLDMRGSMKRPELRTVVRRSLIKTIVSAALKLVKNPDDGGLGVLHKRLDENLYRLHCGCIPVRGTAADPPLRALFAALLGPKETLSLDVAHAEKKFGRLLKPEEVTVIAVALRGYPGSYQTSTEAFVDALAKADSGFAKLWDGHGGAVAAVGAEDGRRAAEKRLSGYHAANAAHKGIPEFVTPLGPSVYRCVCGAWFGDPATPLSAEALEAMKKNRNEHFQKIYKSDVNGYPTRSSSHYPLHRTVQIVVGPGGDFKDAKVCTEAMVRAVAERLLKKNKGDIYGSEVEAEIRAAVESYLRCRAKGMEETVPRKEGDGGDEAKDRADGKTMSTQTKKRKKKSKRNGCQLNSFERRAELERALLLKDGVTPGGTKTEEKEDEDDGART